MYMLKNRPSILTDETLVVVRPAATSASVVDGIRIRDSASNLTFTCIGNVQPLSGRDLAMAPEGERQQGQLNWWIWKADVAAPPQVGDIVRRDGSYLVTSATDWGSYVLCRLVRDDAATLRED